LLCLEQPWLNDEIFIKTKEENVKWQPNILANDIEVMGPKSSTNFLIQMEWCLAKNETKKYSLYSYGPGGTKPW
jgi:hypothetical protein